MDKRLKYYDLMEQLHGKIMSGEIRPGEKLPSENELSAEYGVSRQTVRKALQICRMRDTYMRNMAAEPSARRCYGTRRRPKISRS